MKHYRRFFALVLAGALLLACAACGGGGVRMSFGKSDLFSEDEIKSAADAVIEKFNSDFTGCTMTKLWYDEAVSTDALGRKNLHSEDDLDPDNSILLLCNFTTSADLGPFEPNSTYRQWAWTLVRENPDSDWIIQNYGYG